MCSVGENGGRMDEVGVEKCLTWLRAALPPELDHHFCPIRHHDHLILFLPSSLLRGTLLCRFLSSLASGDFFRMLETFEILTASGVVLWSKSYAPVGAHIINSLINDVFIEEKIVPQNASTTGVSPVYKKEKYTLKWKTVKEFNLIFVVRLSHIRPVLSQNSPGFS